MKIFCLILLFLISFTAKSQTYPFPAPGAKWNILQNSFGFLCTIKYEYEKDTFMCGYNYAVISNQNQNCNWWSLILIRSVGNLVYGRIYDCLGYEYLLYNFNLNLGDTFIAAANINDTAIVTNVSYGTMLDGSIRKQITLISVGIFPMQYNWIEGIGDLTSLFYNYILYDPDLTLLCFEDSLALIYKNTFWNTCDTSSLTSNNENNVFPSLFIAYPNPTTDIILIKYSVNQDSKSNISLRDFTGRLLKSYYLESGTGTISINENDLPVGLFFFSLYDNKKHLLTKKIIKTQRNESKN